VGANDFQYEVVVNLSDHGFLSCDPDQYHWWYFGIGDDWAGFALFACFVLGE
jgi:hypothetical protein